MHPTMTGQLQQPIIEIRKVQLPYLAYATALSQISLFLALFWSTFPAKMEALLHVRIRYLI